MFTVGKDRFYEQLMQQKPGFDRRLVLSVKERDCKHCLYFDVRLQKCAQDKCIVYGD